MIEPRAVYRYVTGIGDNFNHYIRFDQRDIIAANEMLLSLTNRLYAKRGDNIEEILTWELTQKRYFDPTFGGASPRERATSSRRPRTPRHTRSWWDRGMSPIVSKLRASPIGGVGVEWRADYDPFFRSVVDSNLSLYYRWNQYSVQAGQQHGAQSARRAGAIGESIHGRLRPGRRQPPRPQCGILRRLRLPPALCCTRHRRSRTTRIAAASACSSVESRAGVRDETLFRIAFLDRERRDIRDIAEAGPYLLMHRF